MDTDIRPKIRFATTAIPATLVILACIALGIALASAAGWTATEMDFLRTVNRLHTPVLDRLALGIDWLFEPAVAGLLLILGAGIVAWTTRRVSSAVRFLVIVAVPWLGTEVIKQLVHRARPDIPSLAHPLVLEAGGLSFPSGHTAFATSLVLGVVILARGSRWMPAIIGVAAITSLATAASRIYLGVHYPSDVIASIVYSLAAVALVNAVWILVTVRHWNPQGVGRRTEQQQGSDGCPPIPQRSRACCSSRTTRSSGR